MAPKPSPLWLTVDWIEAHCAQPDGDVMGARFLLGDEQASFLLKHYLVKPTAKFGDRASAFVYYHSQLVRAQKWGKSPLVAAQVCLEAVGPALFAGWASRGDVYRCEDHGCPCGWRYEYAKGEAMGRPWPTPLIQITATSSGQTDNTYDALRPMIGEGPLSLIIPNTGEERIDLPGRGKIEPVTSKANSRLGQRVTFVSQDETGIWTDANGMTRTANVQRRGLAGMGGRACETTNAWDPTQNSVAQQTYESQAPGINRDFRQADPALDWKKASDRKKILRFNYAGAPWVKIDDIVRLVDEMMPTNPADAERFFGNRIVYGDGSWLPKGLWDNAYAGALEGARA